MQYEHGLSMIQHCLGWYKLVLLTHLSIPAMHHLVQKLTSMTCCCEVSVLTTLMKRVFLDRLPMT